MLRHVVLFTWKADVSDVEVRAFAEGLAALPSRIPEIRSYRFGPDAGLVAGNDEFAVVAGFDDVEGYRSYAGDAHHVDVIERLLKPIISTRHAVQFLSEG